MRTSGTAILLLSATLAGVQGAEKTAKPPPPQAENRAATNPIGNLGVQEFEKLRTDKTNLVLDVRTPREFASGHVPAAINIDLNAADFDKKVSALDKRKTYLVYCGVGVRSARACEKLKALSFGHLYNLEGGFRAWEKAGNKPEK